MKKNGERTRRSGTAEDHPAGPIEEGHRVLRSQLEALTNTANHPGILSGLQDLPKWLAEHFAEEEAVGGLYDDLARRCPAICDEIEALRGEHGAMLDALETLSREAKSQPGPDAEISETTIRRVVRLADRLQRHEHAESKMIADVYYTDEGGSG